MATFLNRFQREKSDKQSKHCKMSATDNAVVVPVENVTASAVGKTPTNSTTQTSEVPSAKNKGKIGSTTTATAPSTAESSATNQQQQPPRSRHRYMRSATAASVTQLLSDSCNSLLQRFRRNPSERPDKHQQQRRKPARYAK